MIDNKDVFGKGLWQYHQSPNDQKLITWTCLTFEDPVTLSYFFRTFDRMPTLEKKGIGIGPRKSLRYRLRNGMLWSVLTKQKNSVLGE